MSPSRSFPVVHEPSSDVPLVELRQVFTTGAALEPVEIQGVGRLALRLLRRGAAGRTRKEMDEALDRIAAVVSAQASSDFYALHLRVLRRYLDRAMDLLADLMHRPTLAEDELDRLKRETVAEIVSSRDDDRYLASRALRMKLFEGHAYGRSTRGTIETVGRITREHVVRFIEEHLVSGTLLLGVAGDIQAAELDGVVGLAGGALPAGTGPSFDIPEPTTGPGLRAVLVDKPDRTQAQMYIGQVGPASSDPQDLALRLALTAFGGTFTSRLMREVRVKRGWSYGAYASLGRARRREALTLWTFPSTTDAPACLRLVLELYRELESEGPTTEDVVFARDYLARSIALQKDTSGARLTLRLRQKLLGLPEDYYDTFAERVRAISEEQVRRAVKAHVRSRDLVVAVACTADRLEGELRKVLGDEVPFEVVPYDSPML